MQTEKDSPQSGPPDSAKQPSGHGPKVFDEALPEKRVLPALRKQQSLDGEDEKKEGAIDSLLESSRRFAPEI